MKALIHGNGPHVPSGYGKQARLAGRILRDLGHGVAFSCFSGLSGQPIRWDGYTLFPAGSIDYSPDVIVPHALTYGADVIIPLMDFWKLGPAAGQLAEVREQGITTAAFIINDCRAEDGGISLKDRQVLAASHALPLAVSRFGQANLEATGYPDAPYVPHCVDTAVYRPPEDRKALRNELGTPGEFIIGIMAANRDVVRKGFPEQMAAFARFAKRHKDATLALFTEAKGASGIDLGEIACDFGIPDRTIFMPPYEQVSGMLSDEFCAKWFGSLDVLSLCSYAEAFGVPLIEAQACGTPVIATDFSAMTQLAGPAGWLVKGQRFWNPAHRAWWMRPNEDDILKAYERAYQEGPSQERRDRAVAFAADYDVEAVKAQYWAPFLKQFEEDL